MLNQEASSEQKAAQTSWRTPTKIRTAVHSHVTKHYKDSNATPRHHRISPLWFQGRTSSRSACLLPGFCCSWVSANRSVTTSRVSSQLRLDLSGPEQLCEISVHLILWKTASKPLPSICKTNITTRQQGLLSSEIAVFTRKTTDYKQERLIRGDLETAGSPSQHLRRKAVHQLGSRMHWNTQVGNQSSI